MLEYSAVLVLELVVFSWIPAHQPERDLVLSSPYVHKQSFIVIKRTHRRTTRGAPRKANLSVPRWVEWIPGPGMRASNQQRQCVPL